MIMFINVVITSKKDYFRALLADIMLIDIVIEYLTYVHLGIQRFKIVSDS